MRKQGGSKTSDKLSEEGGCCFTIAQRWKPDFKTNFTSVKLSIRIVDESILSFLRS